MSEGNMLIKNHLSKSVILTVVGMALLTQPVQAYVNGLGFGSPAMGTVALGATATTFWITGHQKYNYNGVYSNYPPKKYVEVTPSDGASMMISSVPVLIQDQVSKNIFMGNIPNDRGGYSTVILQKLGNRFIELPAEGL
jgi:hypothetical protein